MKSFSPEGELENLGDSSGESEKFLSNLPGLILDRRCLLGKTRGILSRLCKDSGVVSAKLSSSRLDTDNKL